MVGSPGQRPEHLEKDINFICDLQPDMVGIGPFIPQSDTPFGREPAGNLELTLVLLAMIRVLLPSVLLPATTALGTLHRRGLEMGIQAGANVCMPNLTPDAVRDQYALYEGKTVENGGVKDEKQALDALKERMEKIGYRIVEGRGDRKNFFKISE